MGANADGGRVPLAELALAITTGAVRMAAATAAWLRLVRDFDELEGWAGAGITSCAHWLAWQCGMGPGAAREHVRVARALAGLPRIEAAFAAGRLSFSKVRALTRIADPSCEQPLLEFALTATASQTERFCRSWRRVDDAADHTRRGQREQSFEHWFDDDGTLTIKVRMPADRGAEVMTAIESRVERDARRERAQAELAAAAHERIRAAGGSVDPEVEQRCLDDTTAPLVRERTTARRIAAFADLVTRPDTDRRAGDPPRREVVVHVDADVLAADTAAGRAYVDGGPALTAAQARRLLCEATVVAMIERGREPLALGRRRRLASKAQRQALLRRDGGCVRPGCPETRIERLHAHHTRHWIFGGRTDIEGMVLLCDVDHGLVHDHDLVISRRNGTLVVTGPDGRRVWGGADAAFTTGLDGPAPDPAGGDDPFAGVHPVDTTAGRRPGGAPAAGEIPSATEPATGPGAHLLTRRPLPAGPARRTPSRHPRSRPTERRSELRPRRRPGPRRAPTASTATSRAAERESRRIDRALFPDGAPALHVPGNVPHERLDMAYAIGVLMTNRDLVRRLAAEQEVRTRTGVPAGTP
ncbi:HNH endonuclease signature motif containing protein [Blastococcus sp. TF02A-30]|uniref:HNH endonuclease signature motif containing protein n=1 Tax=Blastococcus sp. TF02A-30 TaxID=2250580 RepID=UPI0018F7B388|nr:HNH endonuclease signature motif containing protein [Blastococcus sp. TF02A-30]